MTSHVILAALTPVPFALIEWVVAAIFVLYWYPRPSSVWKSIAQLAVVACMFGFLFIELRILPFVAGSDTTAGYVFFGESIGTMLVTAILTFVLAHKVSKDRKLLEPGDRETTLPASSMIFRGIAALVLIFVLLAALPRGFIKENSFLVSAVLGPILGILLAAFGVPVFRRTNSKK